MAARIAVAGVEIVEVRISHLAYAPEIAQVMLQRQQAAAVISARSRIVEGAVGMVEMALNRMTERNIVELDDERRAAMVSNLLVDPLRRQPGHPDREHRARSTSERQVSRARPSRAGSAGVAARPERKPALLRLDPAVHAALARWAADDLRSFNAHVEWLLRRALSDAGRLPAQGTPDPDRHRARCGSGAPDRCHD